MHGRIEELHRVHTHYYIKHFIRLVTDDVKIEILIYALDCIHIQPYVFVFVTVGVLDDDDLRGLKRVQAVSDGLVIIH